MTERLHFHFSLSCTGEGNGNPLQCFCLENPRDGESGGLPSMGLQSRTRLRRLSSSSSRIRCVVRNMSSPCNMIKTKITVAKYIWVMLHMLIRPTLIDIYKYINIC